MVRDEGCDTDCRRCDLCMGIYHNGVNKGDEMKLVEKISLIVLIVLSIWFFASYIDVLAHNDPFAGNYQYHAWNVFTLVFDK